MYLLSSLSNQGIKCHVYEKQIRERILKINGYWYFRIINELIVLSWFHEKHKLYCLIIISFTDVGIRFSKGFVIMEHSLKT